MALERGIARSPALRRAPKIRVGDAVLTYQAGAEFLDRFVLVMRPAAELDVLLARGPAARERDHVMELEIRGRRAAPWGADERTPSVVACPHRASDRGRNGASL